jgi:tripartite-type tricarboxylate transporter receptor subunit TctC
MRLPMSRSFPLIVTSLMAVLATATACHAQSYPARPVTLVVGFTPGGPSDVIARILGGKLGALLGQTFVILNRPGAGGNLAAEHAAQSAPDGHTLLMGNNSILATNAALYKKLRFDPVKDFKPISLIGVQANILVVHPNVKARTVPELIALAKAQPDKLSFASSGHGAAAHLAGELFKSQAKVGIQHIPYKGAAPALQDVIAGRVDLMFATSASVIGHVRARRVVPLAVTTAKRFAALPEVPTVAEQGLPGFEASTWHGLVAPSATPAAVIATLHKAMSQALADPEVVKSLTNLGVDITPSTPAEFERYIAAEIPKWTAIVKASGAKIE